MTETNWPTVATYAELLQVINAFSARHPEAKWSFAHIVIDDHNLADDHIRYCLRQDTIDRWFNDNLTAINSEFIDLPDDEMQSYLYNELIDLRDTIICFLRYLLTISEEIRDKE